MKAGFCATSKMAAAAILDFTKSCILGHLLSDFDKLWNVAQGKHTLLKFGKSGGLRHIHHGRRRRLEFPKNFA